MENRFKVLYEKKGFNSIEQILVDNETGVQYLYHAVGYGGGITPLLDSEGKPIIKKDEGN